MEVMDAPYDTTIYIGSRHTAITKCSHNTAGKYEKVLMRFDNRHGKCFLTLGVKVCTECGAIFLPFPKWQRFWAGFSKKYSFIRAKNGKLPSEERIRHRESKPETNYTPPKYDYREQYEIPAYIRNGIRHPYRGGLMCPK